MDMSRPDDAVDRTLIRLNTKTRLAEVNLAQPFSATPIFLDPIGKEQQVDIRGVTRITSRPRSHASHGANVGTLNRPIHDRMDDAIGLGTVHRTAKAGLQYIELATNSQRASQRLCDGSVVGGPLPPTRRVKNVDTKALTDEYAAILDSYAIPIRGERGGGTRIVFTSCGITGSQPPEPIGAELTAVSKHTACADR